MADDDNSKKGAGGRREAYRLTDRERDYIRTSNAGTDRPSRLRNNIRTKRDRLPERFRELFLDVEVLELGDYFEPQEWEDGWKRLINMRSQEQIKREYLKFGRRLGVMTRRLTLYPDDPSESDIWADFIFGFLDGLCFHLWENHPRRRDELLQELLTKVEDRAEHVFDERASEEMEWFNEYTDRNQKRRKGIQEIEDILESEGIEQPKSIALQVYRLFGGRTYSPNPDEITKDEVVDIVGTNELVLRRELQAEIDQDIEELETCLWGDLSALDLLQNIPDTPEPISSRQIANKIDSPQKHLNSVVKLGLFLVGEEELNGELWDGMKVMELVESEDTYGDRKWRLTDYGKAVQEIYLDRSNSFKSLDEKESPQKYFEHAIVDPDVRDYLKR